MSAPAASLAELQALAARLGGSLAPESAPSGGWRIDVPSGRWEELVRALRDLGVGGDALAATPPADASCACVSIR